MLNADRLPHSTICQNESTFNIPDWVAGDARARQINTDKHSSRRYLPELYIDLYSPKAALSK